MPFLEWKAIIYQSYFCLFNVISSDPFEDIYLTLFVKWKHLELGAWLKVVQNLTPWFLPCIGVDFVYEGQKPLFQNVDFGIDMDSRSKYAASIVILG